MSEEVAKIRSRGIGGSDVAAICGLSPWKTAYQVWEDKLGMSERQPMNDRMAYGLMVEPVIRQWYADETGRAVRLPNKIIAHPRHDFMIASLDGFTDDNRVIEIKTAGSSKEWGEPGSDEIPVYYRTQVEHYLIVTGFEVADVVVSFSGQMPLIYEVPADKELQEMLIEKEAAFWELVKSRTPPEPVTYTDMVARFKKSTEVTITATPGIVEAVRRLREFKALSGAEEELKAPIMGFMGEADTLLDVDGTVLVTWRSPKKAGKRFNMDAFKSDHPDIYAEYLREQEASRRFLIK